ncbi:MAG: hypothetical protein LQ352_006875 [Teloschistes flavicans]|nr:MAG: hypothetical protein LQ352_006875 [Teloschistes flavicans]
MALSWNDLPKEIRLHILTYTDLVRRYDHHWHPTAKIGANVRHGRLSQRPERRKEKCLYDPHKLGCRCYYDRLPTSLFLVSQRMHYEAEEIFYSRNRFILSGELWETCRLLANLPPRAYDLIRMIDLELDMAAVLRMFRKSRPEWSMLISLIQNLLLLDKLWLSIDAASILQEHESLMWSQYKDQEIHAVLRQSYYHIFGPLRQFNGLKKCHVFLSQSLGSFEYEAVLEREIMGPKYDSTAEGKLAPSLRYDRSIHRRHPSGKERSELDLIQTIRMVDSPPAIAQQDLIEVKEVGMSSRDVLTREERRTQVMESFRSMAKSKELEREEG